jgi:hypothetical protein
MDERFLDGVFCPLPVMQDEACDRVKAIAGGCREDLEGLVITASRRFHDIALHRLLHRLRDRMAALSPYDGQRVTNRSRIASGELAIRRRIDRSALAESSQAIQSASRDETLDRPTARETFG